MTCCRARGKVTAVGDRKKTGWAFRMGIPILGTMFSPGELWPEPPTETALLRQLAVDQGGGRVQGQDHSHRPKNDSGHRDPKQPSKRFHPGLCPSQRGPKFAGEGADIQQQSQAERLPRCGDALETRFCSVALRNRPGGGRSRNAKRPGALTEIDLAESADCPCDVIR
jgi:hypothetical protein